MPDETDHAPAIHKCKIIIIKIDDRTTFLMGRNPKEETLIVLFGLKGVQSAFYIFISDPNLLAS